MSCEQYESLIGELVDGTLDGAERHELEHHLATCQACTRVAEELLVVRRAARSLPPLDPPPAAWDAIAARIEAERAAPQPSSTRSFRPWMLAAAAVLVAAVAAGLLWTGQSTPTPPSQQAATTVRPVDPATATSAELLGSVEQELQQAEKHFESAVAGLEKLARDRQALDPQVAADLQKSLLVIDQAIGESRAALKTQPMSTQAQDSLFDAFRSKIVLLQDTIALINEVRKGNQAEAARIANGANKS